MQIGQTVTISQGDAPNTILTGTISRIWGKDMTLVTVKVPGIIAGTYRTFVRAADSVKPV